MTTALLYKEFRETLPIAAVGLVVLLLVALGPMGYPNPLGQPLRGQIPFVGYSDSFNSYFGLAAGALAIALGLWQSLGDFWGGAQLFVLHRPVGRGQIYGIKLAVGITSYLICGAIPIALYSGWAATPGTHASPFEWSMTSSVWLTWLSLVTLYLGAFLSGIRPAAWFGTRLAPLAAAAVVLPAQLMSYLSIPFASVISLLVFVAANIALATSIFFVIRARDFA